MAITIKYNSNIIATLESGQQAILPCEGKKMTSDLNIICEEASTSGGDVEEALLTRTITEYSNNTLTKIGDYAFAGCTTLESIDLPNLTSAGNYAFYNCDKLTSISFPNLITVGSYAFSDCNKLTSFDIPNVRSIGDSAFSYCTTLREITIPENVTTLSDDLFRRCTSLESAIFMGDITETRDTVFYECTNLKTIDFIRCTSVPTMRVLSSNQNFVRNHSDELKIYVPWSLYTQWKSAEHWSYWADHIDRRIIEDVPTISLNGDILTMNDPSGIATAFVVTASNEENTYYLVVEGNTIDLSTLCEESGTYTVVAQSRDGSGAYGDSRISNEIQYTYTKPKLDAPEIWLESNGYSITFDNPVLYSGFNTSAFTFYIDDTAYTGSQLATLQGQTFEGVKKIACVSTNGYGDHQYVEVNNNDSLISYNGNYVEYELTEDVYSCYFSQHACLSVDTLVTMADNSTKQLGDIVVGDMVKSWDFENNVAVNREITSTNLDAMPKFRTAQPYYKLTFSDGTIINHAATHRFYNVEQKAFVYTIYWNIGEHTYKEDGTLVSLVSRELIEEPMVHGMITMDDYTCYFANGLMTGDRRCPTDIVVGEQ